jgi:type IV secretory pathway VirB4 component
MPKKNATQQFVPIQNIRDGVVILRNGQMCMVLLASSINFAFKSIEEQEGILSQFQAFLNTIDFSLQIYIQSRRLDIRPYIALLKERQGEQDNDLMRIQLKEYIEFIKTFTKDVDIMAKNFFVVVPYTPALGDVKKGLSGMFGSSAAQKAQVTEEKFVQSRAQLEQRVSVVEQGLGRLGVRTIPLGTDELVELYYHIFNPEDLSSAPQRA